MTSRAAQNCLAGHMWPAGRGLGDINKLKWLKTKLFLQNTKFWPFLGSGGTKRCADLNTASIYSYYDIIL